MYVCNTFHVLLLNSIHFISFHFVGTSTGCHRQICAPWARLQYNIFIVLVPCEMLDAFINYSRSLQILCELHAMQLALTRPDRSQLIFYVSVRCMLVLYSLPNEVNTITHMPTYTRPQFCCAFRNAIQRCRFDGQFMHVVTVYRE